MQQQNSGRRSFLSGVGAALAGVGLGSGRAAAQSRTSGSFQPARHNQDEWLAHLPGKHRIVIDAVTPKGAGEAVLYANNMFVTNKAAYSLDDKDLAIVIVMRHFATPFAYNEAFWAKYGKPVGTMLEFKDPKTQQPPSTNLYNNDTYGLTLPNLGNTIDAVTKRGAVIAICDLATHFIASQLAGNGGNADAIYKELAGSALVPSSKWASAGVVAVTRAQELGYTLIYAG
jgi:hypothetical protein